MTGVAHREGTSWRQVVEPYVGANLWHATYQVISTIGLLGLSMWAVAAALDRSLWLALVLAPLTAGLLVRTFILMHDCAHGSLFASRRATEVIGFITGVLTLTPFTQWRRDHALHHASSGDLDRRGHGDVPTLTVREYQAKTEREQFWYRVIRHPASLMFGGPIHLMVSQRMRPRSNATRGKQAVSVMSTNGALAVLLGVCLWAFGWKVVVFAYLIPFYLAAMAGVWLFYVQHQFEDAYWEQHNEWDYLTASLKGSASGVARAVPVVHREHRFAPRASSRTEDSELPAAKVPR